MIPLFLFVVEGSAEVKGLLRTEKKLAIIIGIDNYSRLSGFSGLKYARKDSKDLQEALKNLGYEVKVLLDSQASKSFILDAINDIYKLQMNGEGSVIFIFSGHGFNNNNDDVLATYDSIRNVQDSGLRLTDVHDNLKRTNAKQVMIFIDACRTNTNDSKRSGSSFIGFKLNTKLSRGIKVFVSTVKGKASYENSILENGILFRCLIVAKLAWVIFKALATSLSNTFLSLSLYKTSFNLSIIFITSNIIYPYLPLIE